MGALPWRQWQAPPPPACGEAFGVGEADPALVGAVQVFLAWAADEAFEGLGDDLAAIVVCSHRIGGLGLRCSCVIVYQCIGQDQWEGLHVLGVLSARAEQQHHLHEVPLLQNRSHADQSDPTPTEFHGMVTSF